jgi:hypothetical protein
MRTWKIIVAGAALRAAFIVTIAVAASNGFELDRTVADHAPSPRQQQMSVVVLEAPAQKTESATRQALNPGGHSARPIGERVQMSGRDGWSIVLSDSAFEPTCWTVPCHAP